MGTVSGARQGAGGPALAAFDFDGTLTWRDSFMAFLAWRAGPVRYALGLARLAPAALAYLGHRDRGRLKAAAAREFLAGVPLRDLERSCAAFERSPLGTGLIRPDAEQCWRDWRTRGAQLVIVTASPEEVVAPFAKRLGADVLIGTRLELDEAGRVSGALVGENCRGEEKVRRLRERFGRDVTLQAAYGDTGGDLPMLGIAGIRGYRVFKSRRPRGG